MESYDRLVKLVMDTADDVQKGADGNVAAGRRARGAMMAIKKAAQEVRIQLNEIRKEMKTDAAANAESVAA